MMLELADLRLLHPRDGAVLVEHANFGVQRGEVVVIVGAAGIGTSRLVAAALGEAAPAEGTISVLGRDVSKLRRSSLRLLRRRVGVVPQDLALLGDRSAQLNVVLPLEIDGVPRAVSVARAAEVLAQMGLEDEASLPVECLSASARQRVAVARALVRAPELILADHPTSMQDAAGTERICEAFYEAAAQGASVVVFSRDPALRSIAERNQWRQLALADGRLSPIADVDGHAIDKVLAGMETSPSVVTDEADILESMPNVVPFPLSAQTAGVG
ncbi:MAG: ATP-binding cassette domain-containing protein [Kofleriaceae bacterium]